MSVKSICVIPARYGSSRFPGKVLADLLGKPVIQHVYEKAAGSKADAVLIAADDERVIAAVNGFGGKAGMTSPSHNSGTDRIYEAVADEDYDIIINVQGDEPLLPSKVIDELIDLMKSHPEYEMATVAVPAKREEVSDPNRVKVVFNASGRALYFSRSVIPYLREGGEEAGVYRHWGIYAYRKDVLSRFVQLPGSSLENCEKLEQLRALENGISIHVMVVDELESLGVDTPEDLKLVEKTLREKCR